jgi:CBS domain-containing protein
MIVAKDIMTRDPITIHYTASLRDLAKLLAERGITGVPVIDDDRNLLGMVSMRDLITEEVRSIGANLEYQDIYELFSSALNIEEAEGVAFRHLWVEEIMTRNIHAISEATSLREICTVMHIHNVHRLPVLRASKLVGLVTTMDVLRALAQRKLV